MTGCEAYLRDSVDMVETAHPVFLSKGMVEDHCFSEDFSFAPQINGGANESKKGGASHAGRG